MPSCHAIEPFKMNFINLFVSLICLSYGMDSHLDVLDQARMALAAKDFRQFQDLVVGYPTFFEKPEIRKELFGRLRPEDREAFVATLPFNFLEGVPNVDSSSNVPVVNAFHERDETRLRAKVKETKLRKEQFGEHSSELHADKATILAGLNKALAEAARKGDFVAVKGFFANGANTHADENWALCEA